MNVTLNHETKIIDLGLIDYQRAWDYQTSLFNSILDVKKGNLFNGDSTSGMTENFLLFCEHPHVFTLGKSGDEKNLLIKKNELDERQATFVHTNRGGDITYHGPGQLVAYPIFDLENFFTDIHRYMRYLEEAVIQTLAFFSLEAGRIPGLTGVWIDPHRQTARKICAMGVKTSRWVTMHGLALNINTNLQYFDYIVPCGIRDKAVTSMQKELGTRLDMEEVKEVLQERILILFQSTAI